MTDARAKPAAAAAAAVSAAAAVALSVSGAAAGQEPVPDLSGVWQVKFERSPSGQALIDELPDGVVMIDDAGGGELGAGDFAGLELTEAALEQIAEYDYAEELKRENTCVPPSVVFYMQAPFPIEIHQGRDLIVIRAEYFDMTRVIHLNETEHPPPEAPHFKSGHSIGRWEGDTLVVDTTHIAPGTFMNNGVDHSENIHLIEHFRLSPDGDTLWLTQLYEDPAIFAGKAARYMAWTRDPDGFLYPYDCDPSYGE
ncbi:MAG TPA: hypothetical protein VF329_14110 [Gammaproteobacteria bacterium]